MLYLLQASLWFILEDISVGFALPQMPNTLSVGDIMAGRPGKALPRDMEDFMSASKDGLILSEATSTSVFPKLSGNFATRLPTEETVCV